MKRTLTVYGPAALSERMEYLAKRCFGKIDGYESGQYADFKHPEWCSSLAFKRGWGTEIRVEFKTTYNKEITGPVNYREGWGSGERHIEVARVRMMEIECYTSWSSTTRCLASAVTAVSLYREVIEAAAQFQHMLNSDLPYVAYRLEEIEETDSE